MKTLTESTLNTPPPCPKNGVHFLEITPSVSGFSPKARFAMRRNFYNSPVWQGAGLTLPQELRVLGLVVGLNAYGKSPWRLIRPDAKSALILEHVRTGITIQPELIPDLNAFEDNPQFSREANLYGGAALAFFSPRSCYFFADDAQCSFCSLAGTADEEQSFSAMLSPKNVRSIVFSALERDPNRIEQIMIVGGNMRDLNRGFRHHVELAVAVNQTLLEAGVADTISIHISTMPPRDLKVVEELQSLTNVHVMFNLEVWDSARFDEICPGKARDYGRSGMLNALERLRDVIGEYRAHSLLVTGLESSEITIAGAMALASMGISPIINIYHSDRYSRLGLGKRPSFVELTRVAYGLQSLYEKFPLKPYWKSCGRNSIDTEAKRGLFRAPIPKAIAEDAS